MLKIDALYLLLLIEAVLILIGAAVFLFLRSRKWKRLALQAPAPPSEAGNRAGEEEMSAENARDDTEMAREETEMKSAEQTLSDIPPQSSEELESLRGIVEKQRARILELMCYQDLFETARGRLSALLDRNDNLSVMLEGLQGADAFKLRRDEALSELQMSSSEIESFIEVLGREND
ncbi:MAG TPA: hypothetical protein VN260_00110, partial [Dissulfurispiraceae bacterium]|nr:hypothetical protein [Dissulfurispiraceae bacterium]